MNLIYENLTGRELRVIALPTDLYCALVHLLKGLYGRMLGDIVN